MPGTTDLKQCFTGSLRTTIPKTVYHKKQQQKCVVFFCCVGFGKWWFGVEEINKIIIQIRSCTSAVMYLIS